MTLFLKKIFQSTIPSNVPFPISLFWYFFVSSWHQNWKLCYKQACKNIYIYILWMRRPIAGNKIIILKGFINNLIINKVKISSFSILTDCCMSIFFLSFLIKALVKSKLIKFYHKAFIICKYGEFGNTNRNILSKIYSF